MSDGKLLKNPGPGCENHKILRLAPIGNHIPDPVLYGTNGGGSPPTPVQGKLVIRDAFGGEVTFTVLADRETGEVLEELETVKKKKKRRENPLADVNRETFRDVQMTYIDPETAKVKTVSVWPISRATIETALLDPTITPELVGHIASGVRWQFNHSKAPKDMADDCFQEAIATVLHNGFTFMERKRIVRTTIQVSRNVLRREAQTRGRSPFFTIRTDGVYNPRTERVERDENPGPGKRVANPRMVKPKGFYRPKPMVVRGEEVGHVPAMGLVERQRLARTLENATTEERGILMQIANGTPIRRTGVSGGRWATLQAKLQAEFRRWN